MRKGYKDPAISITQFEFEALMNVPLMSTPVIPGTDSEWGEWTE